MLIYDFIRKVQDEERKSRAEATRLNNQQSHGLAYREKLRAEALHEVLTWAGFEGCVVVKEEAVQRSRDILTPPLADWIERGPAGKHGGVLFSPRGYYDHEGASIYLVLDLREPGSAQVLRAAGIDEPLACVVVTLAWRAP